MLVDMSAPQTVQAESVDRLLAWEAPIAVLFGDQQVDQKKRRARDLFNGLPSAGDRAYVTIVLADCWIPIRVEWFDGRMYKIVAPIEQFSLVIDTAVPAD